jgi:hypothetical protein
VSVSTYRSIRSLNHNISPRPSRISTGPRWKAIILGGELRLFGALGIAFGPGRNQHRVQRGNIVRQGLGGRVHRPIGPCHQRRAVSCIESESIGRRSPRHLGSRNSRRVYPPPIETVERSPTGISPVVRLTKRRSTKSRFWTRGIPFTGDPSACFAARHIAGATSRLSMKSNIVMDQVS